MTPEQLEADKRSVVKVCNRIRKRAGIGSTSRMSRGIPSHFRACTVAMTLDGTGIIGISSAGEALTPDGWYTLDRLGLDVDDIDLLGRFIRRFDERLYPELEIPLSEVKVDGRIVEPA